MKKTPTAYLYLAPGLIFLGLFIILPIVFLFILSFFKWNMFSGAYAFRGLENYARALGDPQLFEALKNTAIYVIGVIVPAMAFGLLLAVLLNSKIKGYSFYRSAIFLPVVVSFAAAGIIWQWIYNYRAGILNQFLASIGVEGINWLGNPDVALLSVIVVTVWLRIGYNMVIFFAGLQVIPEELYEAAKVDGAYSFSRFRYVTWPNLLPTTSFVLIINLIFAFRDFDQIFTMTRGGPMGKTTTLVYYIYETAFSEFNIGYAAAVSIILFVLVMALTYVKIKYLSAEEA